MKSWKRSSALEDKERQLQHIISILCLCDLPTFGVDRVVDVVFTTGTAVVDVTLAGGVKEVTARTSELDVTFVDTTGLEEAFADVACTGFVDEETTRAVVLTAAKDVVVVDIVLISPAVGAPARACSFGI
jgi:hypothetical protein